MKFINEALLKKYLVNEGYDIIRYNMLNEDEKQMFTKEIVTKIVMSIENRAYQLDNVMINKSKGDIEQLNNYNYIVESISLLSSMKEHSKEVLPYFNTVNDAHKNLLKYKEDFMRGYKLRNEVVQLLYAQLVLAEIQTISFIISSTIDYIKDPLGNYEANIRYNIDKLSRYPTVNIESLDKFNLIANNGELSHFFSKIYSNEMLKEDGIFTDAMEALSDVAVIGIEGIGAIGMILLLISRLIPSIPELLRMMVGMSYFTRVKTSDYIRLQANYIELNVERLKNLNSPNKNSIRKQEKIIKNLNNLANAIDIDQKTADKKTRIAMEKEDNEIKKEMKKDKTSPVRTHSVSAVPSEPSHSNVEQILL